MVSHGRRHCGSVFHQNCATFAALIDMTLAFFLSLLTTGVSASICESTIESAQLPEGVQINRDTLTNGMCSLFQLKPGEQVKCLRIT